MKVFLSWSGNTSHQVAKVFREWLPSVIQSLTPYVSSEDISKGERWSIDIAKELEDSSFGILCLTKDSVKAPWLLFEAGALSKMVDNSAVCPFLFNVKTSEIEGPLLQFQATMYEKEDVRKLVFSLNKTCGESGLKEELLNKSFDLWWPTLKDELDKIKTDTQDEKTVSKKQSKEDLENMLEEILLLSRTNQKLLRSPDSLLPPDYLNSVLRNGIGLDIKFRQNPAFDRLVVEISRLRPQIDRYREILANYEDTKKRVDKDLIIEYERLYEQVMHLLFMFNRVFDS